MTMASAPVFSPCSKDPKRDAVTIGRDKQPGLLRHWYPSLSSSLVDYSGQGRAYHALDLKLKRGTLLFEWPESTVATLEQSGLPTALLELRFFGSDVNEAYVHKCSSIEPDYACWAPQFLAPSAHPPLLAIYNAEGLRADGHASRAKAADRKLRRDYGGRCHKLPAKGSVVFLASRQDHRQSVSPDPFRYVLQVIMPLWRRTSIERKRGGGTPKFVESCVYINGSSSPLSASGALRCAHARCCALFQQDVPRIRIRIRHCSVVTKTCFFSYVVSSGSGCQYADGPIYQFAHVSLLLQNFDCSAMLNYWSAYGSDKGVVDRDLRLHSSRQGIVCNMDLLLRFRILASPAVGCATSDEEASCMDQCDKALRSASIDSYRPSACALLTVGVAVFVLVCQGRLVVAFEKPPRGRRSCYEPHSHKGAAHMQLPARRHLYVDVRVFECLVVGIERVGCNCFGGPLRCAGNAAAVRPGMIVMEGMRSPEASLGDGALLFADSTAVEGGWRGCGLRLSWMSASMRWRTRSRPSRRQEPLYYVQLVSRVRDRVGSPPRIASEAIAQNRPTAAYMVQEALAEVIKSVVILLLPLLWFEWGGGRRRGWLSRRIESQELDPITTATGEASSTHCLGHMSSLYQLRKFERARLGVGDHRGGIFKDDLEIVGLGKPLEWFSPTSTTRSRATSNLRHATGHT
ncbi:hypothetical protein BKA58DRAFT_459964 [Alternaria rosae]|uniref:uncharacterized protein n=1 Tax=Alternaria rosae TaxID=1187941 RepID=UPI001E8D6BB5|nr:uncharacterized protein BKA58DRAFT_459964 [Alternaria rosae]KAH6866335.1 hypothetical protein BKA58DRAFT_459964 [Alternaria rosae]